MLHTFLFFEADAKDPMALRKNGAVPRRIHMWAGSKHVTPFRIDPGTLKDHKHTGRPPAEDTTLTKLGVPNAIVTLSADD